MYNCAIQTCPAHLNHDMAFSKKVSREQCYCKCVHIIATLYDYPQSNYHCCFKFSKPKPSQAASNSLPKAKKSNLVGTQNTTTHRRRAKWLFDSLKWSYSECPCTDEWSNAFSHNSGLFGFAEKRQNPTPVVLPTLFVHPKTTRVSNIFRLLRLQSEIANLHREPCGMYGLAMPQSIVSMA